MVIVDIFLHFFRREEEKKKDLFNTVHREAVAGDVDKQFQLATMYSNGEGVAPNDAEALKWLLRAAEEEHVHAQYKLAEMYDEGKGVNQDEAEARKWLRRAAEHGRMPAQFLERGKLPLRAKLAVAARRLYVSAVLLLFVAFGVVYHGLHYGLVAFADGVAFNFSELSFQMLPVYLVLVYLALSAVVAVWKKQADAPGRKASSESLVSVRISAVLLLFVAFGVVYHGLYYGLIAFDDGVAFNFSALSFRVGLVYLVLVALVASAVVGVWRKSKAEIRLEEEVVQREVAEARRQEVKARRAEEEARRVAEEDTRRAEEVTVQSDTAEGRRQEAEDARQEDARRAAEAAAQKEAAEARREAEEARRVAEEAKREAEKMRREAEEAEARRKAEVEEAEASRAAEEESESDEDEADADLWNAGIAQIQEARESHKDAHEEAWKNAIEEADPIKDLAVVKKFWRSIISNDADDAAEAKHREFTRRAKAGDADALYGLGRMHVAAGFASIVDSDDGDAEAAKYYRRAAEKGHVIAQLHLAGIDEYWQFGNGDSGVKDHVDETEQVKWLQHTAEQGHPLAQYELGKRCYYGLGVPENDDQAARWWKRAAEQGHATAQNILGVLHAIGLGVPRDLVQAHKWLNLAAAGGAEHAPAHKSFWRGEMTRTQINEAAKLAHEFEAKKE